MQAMSATGKSSTGTAHDSLSEWEFMQAMSATEKSSTGAVHDSLPEWEFMQAMSATENQAQELHMTHSLDGVHAGNVSNRKIKHRSCT
jgi:hypothetical protein